MRLDRFLANMACGSRKEVRALIRCGKVKVGDATIKDEGFPIDPERDRVILDGVSVAYQQFLYLMLNKPAGVISATEDSRDRTVLDLLAPRYRNRGLFPVGRLDKDTEGLLLLTNHGELGHRLLAPRRHVPKRYFAQVAGEVDQADVSAFREGIDISGYRTLPAELRLLGAGPESLIEIVLHEGKFHQIKRMFEARGKPVLYLKRLSMGGVELDPGLPPGDYRELTAGEISGLLLAADLT